jgi:hypothetical protein
MITCMNEMPDPMTMAHAGSCPRCFYVLPPISEAVGIYFEQGHITCSKCNERSDLWDVVLARMKVDPPMPAMSLVCLGAVRTGFNREIIADKYHVIDLTEVRVPKDATVLQVGYTPQGVQGQGSVFPMELHGNVPQRRVVGNVLHLRGQAMISGNGAVGSASRVSIWVLWIPFDKDESWSYIVNGFDAFVAQHYDRAVVPAQSAVEINIMPIIRELLERHASTGIVKRFMGDRLTFGNVVNIVLPFMCGQAGIPKLPDKIRGSLNTLRGIRNDLVHQGLGGDKITAQQAAEGLCAAVFGCEYAKFAAPKLRKWLV